MKMLNPVGKLAVVLSMSLVLGAGCASWKHGWEMKPFKASRGPDLESVKAYTGLLEKSAVTRDQIEDLIESYEFILGLEPDNLQTMISLSKAWMAMAIGHARDTAEEGDMLRRAIAVSERAMMIKPEFGARIRALPEAGKSVAQAADVLDAEFGGAMCTWALATLLYYEDCLSEVLKITNEEVVQDVVTVLNRLAEVAPEGKRPMAQALRGLAAAVRPKAKMVMVIGDFDAAVAAAPDMIIIRWLQARYAFANFGDKTSMATGYNAIKAADLATAPGYGPMNRVIRLIVEKTRY